MAGSRYNFASDSTALAELQCLTDFGELRFECLQIFEVDSCLGRRVCQRLALRNVRGGREVLRAIAQPNGNEVLRCGFERLACGCTT
jgi:hypothetical protein